MKVRKVDTAKKTPATAANPAQTALEVTWTLKRHLKNEQIAYIRVGSLLARVRDEKLYAALHHPDIESYAAERLHLARASLYRYLQVRDWIAQFHKEWLEPKPAGVIPDLADVSDLIWIENELAKHGLAPAKRAALEELRRKALDGSLRAGELAAYRRQGHHSVDSLRAFLSRLRALRRYGTKLQKMPPEVLADLDAAIEVLQNARVLYAVDLDFLSRAAG
jgi:hypothetical protein